MLNKILVFVRRFFVMRFLLVIAFLVFPSIGFSAMGDVYFCESDILIDIKNGEVGNYKNQKFKFKRTSNGLIFGSEGFLNNAELTSKNNFDVGSELFSYRDDRDGKSNMSFKLEKGIFTFSLVAYQKLSSMIGKCSVF